MNPANPYRPITILEASGRRSKSYVAYLALSVFCYALAGWIYSGFQRWTFETPYSYTNDDTWWRLELPGGIGLPVSAELGWLLIGLLVIVATASLMRIGILLVSAKMAKLEK